MLKFSIIIPICNADREYLYKCFENICKQTYKNLEIICIGEVLTEASLEIIKNFAQKDGRIKLLQYEMTNNAGAKNLGLSEADGDYCYFANPRDLIAPTLFEYAAVLFSKFNMDYVCFSSKIVKDPNLNINTIKMQEELLIRQDGLFDLDFDTALKAKSSIFNKIFKTSLIKEKNITFSETLELEDIPFVWLYNFVAKKVYFDDCIYHYHTVFDDSQNHNFNYAISYINSWKYLCDQLKSVKGLIEENFDNLVKLINIYTEKAKSYVRPTEKFKLEELKQASIDSLNEIILSIERERQRIKQLDYERTKTNSVLSIPSISEDMHTPKKPEPPYKKLFGIEPDISNTNYKILKIFGIKFIIKN